MYLIHKTNHRFQMLMFLLSMYRNLYMSLQKMLFDELIMKHFKIPAFPCKIILNYTFDISEIKKSNKRPFDKSI